MVVEPSFGHLTTTNNTTLPLLSCSHLAAASGCAECCSLLLEKSDEDAENEAGNTPL